MITTINYNSSSVKDLQSAGWMWSLLSEKSHEEFWCSLWWRLLEISHHRSDSHVPPIKRVEGSKPATRFICTDERDFLYHVVVHFSLSLINAGWHIGFFSRVVYTLSWYSEMTWLDALDCWCHHLIFKFPSPCYPKGKLLLNIYKKRVCQKGLVQCKNKK